MKLWFYTKGEKTMKALLLNDLYYCRKNMIVSIIFFVLFSLFQIIKIFRSEANIFIMLSLIIIFNFFAFRMVLSCHIVDEQVGLISYIRGLPIGAKAYVDGKFFLNFLVSLASYLLSLVFYILTIKEISGLVFIFSLFAFIFFLNILMQFLIIKYSYKNSYSYLMILFIVSYMAFCLFYEYKESLFAELFLGSNWLVPISILAIDLVFYFVLRKLSYKNLLERGE